MNVKVVALALLVLFSFAVITNVAMAFNVQLASKVATLRTYNDNPGHEPLGDPVDSPGSPK